MNAAEHLIEQGRAEGREQGREQGRAEGREQGREQGRAEGREQTLRQAIVTTLTARTIPLSAEGRARISTCANTDMLQRWLARAATASSEAHVFATDAG